MLLGKYLPIFDCAKSPKLAKLSNKWVVLVKVNSKQYQVRGEFTCKAKAKAFKASL